MDIIFTELLTILLAQQTHLLHNMQYSGDTV